MPVNTNVNSLLPIRQIEQPVLSTTTTLAGAWIDISGLGDWTLFISGLEAAGVIKIEVANGAAGPTNGIILTSTLAPDANHNANFALAAQPWHWLRVSKTQGTTPTATVATLLAKYA